MNKIILPSEDEELLSECRIDTFRSGGSGRQHVNVTDSAVRLTHLPSGLSVTSQKSRSQLQNKLDCIAKLRERVEKLNYRKPIRIPTKKSRSAKNKILDQKSRVSKKKSLRKSPPSE